MSNSKAVATVAAINATIQLDASNVMQSASEFRKWITTDAKGNVSFVKGAGDHVTVDGLSASVALDATEASSIQVRAANTLRLARQLPEIVEPKFADGKPVIEDGIAVTVKRDAFKVACERIQALCKNDAAFYKVNDLVKALDLQDRNPELKAASVFAVIDAKAYLDKVFGDKKAKKSDPVVKALSAGTGVNAMREVLSEAKAKKPSLFKAKAKATETPKPGDTFTLKQLVADIAHASLTRDHLVKTGQREATVKALLEVADELKSLAVLAGLIK